MSSWYFFSEELGENALDIVKKKTKRQERKLDDF